MEPETDFSGKGRAMDAEPWREALVWMLLLSLLFVLGYSASNRIAAASPHPHVLHTSLDAAMPFWAWTIWPYLALNLIFPCTFFAFHQRSRLRRFAGRAAMAQLLCFALFVLFPTLNVRTLPQPGGVTGMLFSELRAFEQPVNMFPSLHAAILLLVWRAWLPHFQRVWSRWLWHAACALILVSTLTTWQHDIADIASGLALGVLCTVVFRDRFPNGSETNKV